MRGRRLGLNQSRSSDTSRTDGERLAVAGEEVARHGAALPRWQDLEPSGAPAHARFAPMFDLPPCHVSDDTIEALVKWMGDEVRNPSSNNPRIPAGFTYLGQFIDHDITFDPTTKADRSPPVNFRTPRFDLDSLYGSGPLVEPFVYDWTESDPQPPGVRLLVGRGEGKTTDDLPRNHHGRALIGDPRNDENVIVAQLHLLFIHFHNAVVDRLLRERKVSERELFDEAQRIVRWHYQWIVVHEFLPLVVGEETASEVLTLPADGSPSKARLKYFKPRDEPFIPLEFSGAAYRFGHSMVRGDYGIKRLPEGAAGLSTTPLFPNLKGLTWLNEDLVIDWERFFRLKGHPRQVQFSHLIDTAIAKPLFQLPKRREDLPTLNLQRGRKLELPSGQAVATRMDGPQLTEGELHLDEFPEGVQKELRQGTPLWYYILCETARAVDRKGRPRPGRHLGPVGGRIVAEVLVGLLEADPSSYLSERPKWRPEELGTGGDFKMADLVTFARPGRPLRARQLPV
jgi:Animal haem peroxidase